MRNGKLASFVLCFGLLAPNMVCAGETVSKFLQTVEEPLNRQSAETLVFGINSGFMQANSYLAETRHEPPMYCMPEQLTLTDDQLLSMLKQGAEDDPKMGEMTVPVALLAVLDKTFPCGAIAK